MKPIKNEPHMSNDTRIAILETTLSTINATLIDMCQDNKRGFDKVDTSFREMRQEIKDIRQETKQEFERVDVMFREMRQETKQELERVDASFREVRQETKQEFDKINTKIDSIQDRIWSNFLWLIGMMVLLAGLIAHAHHWI